MVNAITYAARRGLHRYLDRHATALRSELAHYLGVAEERLVVGDGAAQLLGAAAQALLEPLDELVTPWPSYGLYPAIAHRARGHAVPVPGFGAQAVLRAVNERTRLVALCNPNDPPASSSPSTSCARCSRRCPSASSCSSTRRCATSSTPRSAMRRSPSSRSSRACSSSAPSRRPGASPACAWGYAVGGPGAEPMLEQLEPELGLNELAQAARSRRCATPAASWRGARPWSPPSARGCSDALRELGLQVAPSQANVLWLRADGVNGGELARRLERHGVIVAPGGPLGDDACVRVTIQRPEAGDRLLRALELSASRLSARLVPCTCAKLSRGSTTTR